MLFPERWPFCLQWILLLVIFFCVLFSGKPSTILDKAQGALPSPGSQPGFWDVHISQCILTFMCARQFTRVIQDRETKGKSLSRARLSVAPWTVACTELLRPWAFLGKNTGVGCRFLLQGIFPTQGPNPGFPHCRQTLYRLSHP